MKTEEKRGQGQKKEKKTFQLSPEAEKVLRSLDKKQKELILKENPFRELRDEAIRELSWRGVHGVVLAEISGLTDSSIARITGRNKKVKFNKREQELKQLRMDFENLLKRYLSYIMMREGGGRKNL